MKGENIKDALFGMTHQLTSLQKQSMKEELVLYVRQLLLNDFNQLVQLLYRVDVDETRLKDLLQKDPETDAALLIADLLIIRQEEKMKARRLFKPINNIDSEEKW
jgi:hypothetical protein